MLAINMVPSNVLQRTFRLQYGSNTGTCFTIDVDGKQYIITARHTLPEATETTKIQIHRGGVLQDLDCALVGLGQDEIDIAVLAPPHAISPSLPLEPTTKNLYLSQDAFFLGFPYGLHAEVGALNADFPLPLVKKACVSMFYFDGPGPWYLLLDGHNNPGFSGGPVVFALDNHGMASNVVGVVSGYKFVWNKVFIEEQETGLAIQYNTGIVVAYSIDHALDIIRSHPIGAPLPS